MIRIVLICKNRQRKIINKLNHRFEIVNFKSSDESEEKQKILKKYPGQVFGVTTNDPLFKYVLDDPNLRPSFFNALINDAKVISSERLDGSMNAFKDYQVLRNLINSEAANDFVSDIESSLEIKLNIKKDNDKIIKFSKKHTNFLRQLVRQFPDIVKAIPKDAYNGSMDFVCKLDNGDYALVETQIIREDCWDRRALAYVANFYGKQIKRGDEWKDIKKVIGINILEGGINHKNPWIDAENKQFLRHYKIQEQYNKSPIPQFMDGIEIFQYSLFNIPNNLPDEKRDWLNFFRNGHTFNDDDVANIKTPAVKAAFERAKLSSLSLQQLKDYDREASFLSNLTGVLDEQRAEGKAEGQAEVIKTLISNGYSSDKIATMLNLSINEINKLTL
jgi:predicted transposase/invertase (TIGR01784 family)